MVSVHNAMMDEFCWPAMQPSCFVSSTTSRLEQKHCSSHHLCSSQPYQLLLRWATCERVPPKRRMITTWIRADKMNFTRVEERASRRPTRLMGVSRTPEYIVGVCSTSFERSLDGKRIAPVSQLNTKIGRILAEDNPTRNNARRRSVSLGDHSGHAAAQHKVTSDRDSLPSQRPRTELSQLLGMTRGSSRRGTTLAQKDVDEVTTKEKVSLPCKHLKYNRSSKPGASHEVAFLSAVSVNRPSLPVTTNSSVLLPEPPPSPQCKTCLTIPGYLRSECWQFFPRCLMCNQLAEEVIVDLVAHGGEVPPLTDGTDKPTCWPSKELQNWCYYVSLNAHRSSRGISKNNITDRITPTDIAKLERRNAMRRRGTARRRPSD
jgi:hypothetical protein